MFTIQPRCFGSLVAPYHSTERTDPAFPAGAVKDVSRERYFFLWMPGAGAGA